MELMELAKRGCQRKIQMGKSELIKDIIYNLVPLMRKKPSALILHLLTKNTVSNSSKGI